MSLQKAAGNFFPKLEFFGNIYPQVQNVERKSRTVFGKFTAKLKFRKHISILSKICSCLSTTSTSTITFCPLHRKYDCNTHVIAHVVEL